MSYVPRSSVRWFVLAVAGGLAALLAGCATGEYTYTTRLADGQRMTFEMVKGRVTPGRSDGFETLIPRFEPDGKQKRLQFAFAFSAEGAPAFKHVRVEDMSEAKAVVLVEDAAPRLTSGVWIGHSAWYPADAPELHWITYLDDSFKVYRFTITLNDGRTIVLHQGFMVAGFMKAMLRQMLGMTP
jgi:hypothetical protein